MSSTATGDVAPPVGASVVVDASVVVAGLVDIDAAGRWAEALFTGPHLVAPHLLPAEVASVLRRLVAAGTLSAGVATLAHADMLDLPIDLNPYPLFAHRIWELRGNITAYDAWYVALAEALSAPLATLDDRLRAAPGPRCEFLHPPQSKPVVGP